MFRFSAFASIALILGSSVPASAQVIVGNATVIDGDTIDMNGTHIRLAHIDAPEAQQTCNREGVEWACDAAATEALSSVLDGQSVSCSSIDTDIHGRQVAHCQTPVFALGREMVRRGLAITLDNAPYEYGEAAKIAHA